MHCSFRPFLPTSRYLRLVPRLCAVRPSKAAPAQFCLTCRNSDTTEPLPVCCLPFIILHRATTRVCKLGGPGISLLCFVAWHKKRNPRTLSQASCSLTGPWQWPWCRLKSAWNFRFIQSFILVFFFFFLLLHFTTLFADPFVILDS
ncbi:hypothetical protein LZ32DRAFT_329967 [Colletotrichum eremochloae]|nr:hypothetical protein LZ32DRAFT_329967 [Colletotrichum eremochloae]